MKKLNDIDMLFLESITNELPEPNRHTFSLGYRLRRREIIRSYEKGLSAPESNRSIRLKYVFIAVIAAVVVLLAGFGIYTAIKGYIVTEYDIYSLLYITGDKSDAPETIQKKFYLDMDMSDYATNTITDNNYAYWQEYENGDLYISIEQTVINNAAIIRLNTEDCLIPPTAININGWDGVYFQTKHGAYDYIFNTGEYILSYVSEMSGEDIENMVKMTKFSNKLLKDKDI